MQSTIRRQGIYWIGTIPFESWSLDTLPQGVSWIKGQQEIGEGGYHHIQLVIALCKKASLAGVKSLVCDGHWELSKSNAAESYVWKDESSVPGTRFEWGERAIKRNDPHDWDRIWECAKLGDLGSIPASIRVQSYRTLRAIQSDFMEPTPMVRTCHVFWGKTGTGKSRTAWDEAGMGAYPKDPRSKFWCGYRDHERVVIDEFRVSFTNKGGIDIGHMLRWLDRYPTIVEVKGGATCLVASHIWITSNIHPKYWYPDLDEATIEALMRRLIIKEFINF